MDEGASGGDEQDNPFTQDDETIVLDRQLVAAAQEAADAHDLDLPSESSEVELSEISEPIIELSEVSEPLHE